MNARECYVKCKNDEKKTNSVGFDWWCRLLECRSTDIPPMSSSACVDEFLMEEPANW